MTMNYTVWKISLRNILKHKVYASVNVFGLALGFTAFILIGLFIRHELSWDRANENYAQIYRVQRHMTNTRFAVGGNEISPHTRAVTAPMLEKQFPEFAKVTLVQESFGRFLSATPDHQVYSRLGLLADSCWFDVFTYHFLQGNQAGIMNDPFSVALSETKAQKLFPDGSALGKTVMLDKKYDLKVSGVYADLPDNSTLRPDYILSFSSLASINGMTRSAVYGGDCMTFVQLKPNVDVVQTGNKIRKVFSGFNGLEFEELELCPLSKVYLDYNGHGQYYVVLFLYGLIGVFILIMSGFNYINLTTANIATRRKEVAVRKVSGSMRTDLIVQFICETVLVSLLALGMAFLFAQFFLPVFNHVVDKKLTLNFSGQWDFILLTIAISLGIGVLSGIYPAFFLSSHKIVSLFKAELFSRGSEKVSLKKVLVVSQFAIATFLILITIAFSMQVRYLLSKELGFDKDNILYTQMTVSGQDTNFDQMRNRILSHPEIVDASVSRHIPFVSFGGGMTNWEGGGREEKVVCRFNEVSYDFVKNMGIRIVAGRDFDRNFPGDAGKTCLINETAALSFGWDNPVGKRLDDNKLTVVGVVHDFIFKDMHNEIEPTIMVLSPEQISGTWTFAFRVDPRNQAKALSILTDEFTRTFPNDPFEFRDLPTFFANADTMKIYHAVSRTVLFFTVFNIFLAVIGLLGLVSYTVERRTKEIGVRKINGSSSVGIFYLLSREYYVLLAFALLIAFPTAWWVYEKIPGVNKLHVQPWTFLLSATILLAVIFITTSIQTYKAATRNPVEALRYE